MTLKVRINRAKHRTGRYGVHDCHLGISCLLNDEGGQCCLGFLGEACGVRREDLIGRLMPPEEIGSDSPWPSALQRVAPCKADIGRSWAETFAWINDIEGIDDETREAWIVEGFRTVLGVDCEFYGEYPAVAS